jgi:hypothetical protein
MSRSPATPKIAPGRIHEFVSELLGDDMHAMRVLSLGNAVVGVIHASALGVHAIGRALATASGLEPKHAIKQVDRLLSNMGLSVWDVFSALGQVPAESATGVFVALDWTDFDADGHAVIALNMITSHGRATPLMWKTHEKSKLRQHRNDYEDNLLEYFRAIVPPEGQRCESQVLADRAFGDQALYKSLERATIDFVIRFRGAITVADRNDLTTRAADLVPASGRAKKYKQVRVTHAMTIVPAIVCVRAKNMKEAWCLATSRSDLNASEIVAAYSKRFTIDESFRDTKDPRFGMGLSVTRLVRTDRRDRLLLIGALAQALLTLLGAACEEVGLDRKLKANTVKRRTTSLFNQGWFWYQAIPTMREEWLRPLMEAFGRMVREQAVCREIFGVI